VHFSGAEFNVPRTCISRIPPLLHWRLTRALFYALPERGDGGFSCHGLRGF
jgi:hypothetical protein